MRRSVSQTKESKPPVPRLHTSTLLRHDYGPEVIHIIIATVADPMQICRRSVLADQGSAEAQAEGRKANSSNRSRVEWVRCLCRLTPARVECA